MLPSPPAHRIFTCQQVKSSYLVSIAFVEADIIGSIGGGPFSEKPDITIIDLMILLQLE